VHSKKVSKCLNRRMIMFYSRMEKVRARFTVIGITLFGFIGGFTELLLAQCPPSGLQSSFTDVLVDGSTSTISRHPVVGMSSTAGIIVMYEGVGPDYGTYGDLEIMAARFSASGSASGSPFPLTQHNTD